MNKKEEQIQFWVNESLNYFRRNYEGKNLRELPLSKYLESVASQKKLNIQRGILEIGCGAGNNLLHLKKALNIKRAVGTEVSPIVVEELTRIFPEVEFIPTDSRTLPFETGEFDLVILRSVLHWVDRNYLLQTIGEAMRVTSKYLIVSDFSPQLPYSVTYHHAPDYLTFKINYQPLIEATGFMRCLSSNITDDENEWTVIRTSLYKKIAFDEAFPLRSKEYFDDH
jgi:SAM-dependent methyltransferase